MVAPEDLMVGDIIKFLCHPNTSESYWGQLAIVKHIGGNIISLFVYRITEGSHIEFDFNLNTANSKRIVKI